VVIGASFYSPLLLRAFVFGFLHRMVGGHTNRDEDAYAKPVAAATSHRPFRFDLNMKFEHHHSKMSPQPVAVAEL
jgi:hypothetical protein